MPTQLIDFRNLTESKPARAMLGASQSILEPVLKTRALNRSYAEFMRRGWSDAGSNFFSCGLEHLGLGYHLLDGDLERIPETGPVFVVANHPFGGIDGLILGDLLRRVRPDVKFLANRLLARVEGMEEHCFFVDPFGGKRAARSNIRSIRSAIEWLEAGHVLATFPAGEVSHLSVKRMRVMDPVWAENLAPLVHRSRATVVPVFFSGRNRNFFQLAGLIHPRLRTVLLPRELMKGRRNAIPIRIGKPISADHLDRFKNGRHLMDYLRLRTYLQRNRSIAEKTRFKWNRRRSSEGPPVIEAMNPLLLQKEIEALSPDGLLHRSGDYAVYMARAAEIPNLLLEIGRLRELTFREVGEGTGTPCDIDKFDEDYRHLFIWNHEENELVGAYRIGLTDEILAKRGRKGIYTTTLFRFKKKLLKRLDPAMELGRSFVVPKYQRKPLSLGLLWKGIGIFIARNPKYCRLFGPVSISKDYQSLSKKMMVAYLKAHKGDPELAQQVKAVRPLRDMFWGLLDRASFCRNVQSIEEVSALVSEIEESAMGVPVLWRQYLKLNAKVLGFNVDPAFNNSLDGLVLVDLRKTESAVLRKYMGAEGVDAFCDFHRP